MKISEMITAEIVRGIKGIKDGEVDIIIGKFATGEGIRVELFLNHSESDIEFIDLARFLFVDAWDYFERKGWIIKVSGNGVEISLFATQQAMNKGAFPKHYQTYLITTYPSRLHAMAVAVAFMWQQEKTNEH